MSETVPLPTDTEPSKRLTLDETLPLLESMAVSFRDVLAYAEEVGNEVSRDPETSVHELRKSIRRARTLLRALRPALRDDDYRSIRNPLREAMRPTSLLRDQDVLLIRCDELVLGGPAARGLTALRARLVQSLEQRARDRTTALVVSQAIEMLRPLPARLLETVDWDVDGATVRDGFAALWQRARDAYVRAAEERGDKDIHRWRKRIKEVRYQLEMMARPTEGPVESLRSQFAALATELGELTDLVALRHYLESQRNTLDVEQSEALNRDITAIIAQRFDRIEPPNHDFPAALDQRLAEFPDRSASGRQRFGAPGA